LLAVLQGEGGAETVEPRLQRAAISAVNLSEVVAKMRERGWSEAGAEEAVAALDLTVCDFDRQEALQAAHLRPLTRQVGLSLGDRACLALAASLGCTAITTDKAWAALDVGIAIDVIR
jgi:ribonuclease VapC